MKNELYLIDKKTYIDHLEREMMMLAAIESMANAIHDLPSNRGSKELSEYADFCFDSCYSMIKPFVATYVHSGKNLDKVLMKELKAPEDAGYIHETDLPRDDMGYDFDTPKEDEGNAEELMEELGKVLDTLLCEVFGNYRSVSIEVDL